MISFFITYATKYLVSFSIDQCSGFIAIIYVRISLARFSVVVVILSAIICVRISLAQFSVALAIIYVRISLSPFSVVGVL